MKALGIVPIRFDAAAPEFVTDALLEFYQWLAESIMGVKAELYDSGSNISKSTIDLNSIECEESPDIVYSKFMDRLRSWGSNVDITIIDLINPPGDTIPGRIDVHLANALRLKLETGTKPQKHIMLLSEIPPKEDPVIKFLHEYINDGRVIIIDGFGGYLGFNKKSKFDPKQFRMQLINSREDPLALLHLKMIRRLGHFKRQFDKDKSYCVRYYYDGKECEREIKDLIESYIHRKYSDRLPILLYYKELTEWLMQPVMAVAKKLGCQSNHVNDFLKTPNIHNIELSIPPLIVFPLVDTGRTVESIIKEWKSFSNLPIPNILSILSSNGSSGKDKFITIQIGDEKLRIDYMLQVERKKYLSDCPMCELGIPFSDNLKEDYIMLSTYDLWEMAEQAGWIPEGDVPSSRGGIEIVPYFYKMIYENGAWLARKIRNRLSNSFQEAGQQPMLIVCKNEEGANALADHLRVFQGFTIIRIPKDEIDLCYNKETDMNIMMEKWKTEPWYEQLRSASKNLPVVLVEEFSVSGGSRDALCRIVREFGLNIMCHLALVDFNPNVSLSHKITCLSLYEIQLGLDKYLRLQK